MPCHFQTPKGGTYELTATIVDPDGRPNQTTMTFWVSGGDVEPARDVAQEVVQIIPDKKEYTPGNTAELLVQAPFYPAEGVVTWRRSGIVKVEPITMTGPTTSLKVPITDGMTPNMGVQVDLVGMAARTDDRPWYEHQNMRDERVEAFAAMLWEGAHEYTYVARATTPGNFVVPPAKAEEMYMPEIFGRSGSDRVIIE